MRSCFLIVRQGTKLDRSGFLRSIVPIDQIRLFPGAKRRHPLGEVARTVDPFAVDAENHVARFDSGRGCRRIRLGFRDESPFVGLQAKAIGDFRGHRLNLNTNPAPCHAAFVLQRGNDILRGVGGNGEANADAAARRRIDRGIDAHHLT